MLKEPPVKATDGSLLLYELESSVFFVAVFEHITKHLDGKSSFFDFKILAEMAKL